MFHARVRSLPIYQEWVCGGLCVIPAPGVAVSPRPAVSPIYTDLKEGKSAIRPWLFRALEPMLSTVTRKQNKWRRSAVTTRGISRLFSRSLAFSVFLSIGLFFFPFSRFSNPFSPPIKHYISLLSTWSLAIVTLFTLYSPRIIKRSHRACHGMLVLRYIPLFISILFSKAKATSIPFFQPFVTKVRR